MNIEKRQNVTKRVAMVAMFCALTYASMFVVKIPVQFLDLDIKDSLIVLCGLLFGPVSAAIISIVVPLLQFITISSTGWYGLIMNVLSSFFFSVVASVIYKYRKNFYGAILALVCGALSMTAVMMIANLFITPLYLTYVLGVPSSMDTVIGMLPNVLLPFNFVKALLNGAIVLLLYKPFSTALKGAGFVQKKEAKNEIAKSFNLRSVLVSVIALLIIAVSLCVIFFVLK
jgi:riboflavin transporter FmnP